MKSSALLCALALVLMFSACSKEGSNPTAPEKEPFPDAFTLNQRLGRGMNLGNALEAPNEGEWGVTLRSEYFDWIKSAGFTSIRLPVRWSAHTSGTAPFTIETAFLRRVDWAVNQALTRDLPVVLNVHHFEELMQNPAAEKARFLAIWEQLAAHYRDHSPALIFELLNEPMGNLTPALWNEYLQEAITVIRKTNPTRTLMVGPGYWYSISALHSLLLPEQDDYLIVSVHYYNPFAFTHQGAEWVPGSEAWLGTQWLGTAAEQQAIAREFMPAVVWAANNQRPLNLGEFGAYSKADMSSRARWTAFVARLAEANGMSWHYWEFIAGFGAYDAANNRWHEPLLNALIPKPGPLP
ncbi:MAG: glycoside hydrolase family 5 protein [candidate division KSB1 bacterium]|nr:glycoside hydrolase family 5 protein [candidate division KSB1 bacterium]MDZ7276255.1 glycoside hydrolase family 5 protein [candidate division KSB1 bacterium]MDZ7287939.1 glycoside hydrolase family 5 protein [candidate division KSB1 bacterium]MDZ7300048.1 glycoside hydrolase family 5 protein [candidate division KSB1 bacterium]MDZ7308750.1 glycoside hydrolase family 5 protein [candidate division KSB1 bacterium]